MIEKKNASLSRGLIYLFLVIILTRLVGVLERRLRKDERG